MNLDSNRIEIVPAAPGYWLLMTSRQSIPIVSWKLLMGADGAILDSLPMCDREWLPAEGEPMAIVLPDGRRVGIGSYARFSEAWCKALQDAGQSALPDDPVHAWAARGHYTLGSA